MPPITSPELPCEGLIKQASGEDPVVARRDREYRRRRPVRSAAWIGSKPRREVQQAWSGSAWPAVVPVT